MPPDPERLCAIDARPLEVGKTIAEALRTADLMAEVNLKFVD
jgi:hypothetical protein